MEEPKQPLGPEDALRVGAIVTLLDALAQVQQSYTQVLETIARSVSRLVGDACVITLISDDHQLLVPVALGHENPDAIELMRSSLTPQPLGSGLAGRVVETGQPLLILETSPAQIHAHVNPNSRAYLQSFGLFSVLIVPLRANGQIIGTLGVSRDQPGRPYLPDDQILLQALADRAALAIANARLVDSLKREIAERERTEEALHASEARFRSLVESSEDMIFTLDLQQRHTGVFGRWLRRVGMTQELFLGRTAREILGPDDASVHEAANQRALAGAFVLYEWSLRTATATSYFQTSLAPLYDAAGRILGVMGIGRDITSQKALEQERERLVQTLQEALIDIKTLRGLIPICASCKRIRDDYGYWQHLEGYLRAHSEAEFTHSLCLECVKRLYPEIYAEAADSSSLSDETQPTLERFRQQPHLLGALLLQWAEQQHMDVEELAAYLQCSREQLIRLAEIPWSQVFPYGQDDLALLARKTAIDTQALKTILAVLELNGMSPGA